MILEKNQRSETRISQGSTGKTVLWKMANYEETNVKLTNTQ